MKQPVARVVDDEQANSGHGQRGHETAGKRCRSRERARRRDGGTAKINDLNEEIFCQASDSAAAPTFVERLMQRRLLRNGRNLMREGGESAQVNGAPLKRRAERIDCVSRAII